MLIVDFCVSLGCRKGATGPRGRQAAEEVEANCGWHSL